MKNVTKEVKGTPGVNASQKNSNSTSNGQAVNAPAPTAEKPTPPPVPAAETTKTEAPKAEATKAKTAMPRTLDEQIQFFLGLERVVNIRRRFEKHLASVEMLEITDEELSKFETNESYGVRIELHDSQRREYTIANPRLVKEMQAHLADLLKTKINEYNEQILTYGETQETPQA